MVYLKKHFKASSLLESVISLTIISVCIYIAVLIYFNVFSFKNTAKYHSYINKINHQFIEMEMGNTNLDEGFSYEEEWINSRLKLITISYEDSLNNIVSKDYYVKSEK